jgi:serine/threonine protein kinase
MKTEEMSEQLEEVQKNVAEVIKIINGDGFFVEAKNLLYRSTMALDENKIFECLDLVCRAKESAIKEKDILAKLNDSQILISKNLAGSNCEEASNYYDQCLKLLKKGKLSKAVKLADEAKINAQPPPEYLLQKAKDNYSKGFKNYKEEKFEAAIVCWKTSIDEYNRAKNISIEKKDQNMIKKIDNAISKTNQCIKDAETTFDNWEMVRFDTQANKKIDSVEALIEDHKYDEAIKILKQAKKDTEKSLQFAEIRKFDEDRKKIENKKINIEKRIEFYKIEKGKHLLEHISQRIPKSPEKSEKELYNLLEYLTSLKINSEELKKIVQGCKKSIIEAKLTQAQNSMKQAEDFYKSEKYYDAREIYEKTQEYLSQVEDEAGKFKVITIIDDVRKLRSICNDNRDNCNDQLFDLPDAKINKLITVKESRDFVFPIKQGLGLFPGEGDKLKKLGRDYDVLNYLGGGGFADVYKAKWKSKNIVVALKIPRELTSSGEKIFFKEIRNWEKLNHRNIVKLIEPRLGPTPHLVIEYVDGTTLDKLLQSPKIEIKEACRIAFDIAAGLECAHSKSIIHCDLKPKNILISKVGEAKITDFGIAKTIVATTIAVGGRTLIYAAPEQLNGKPDYSTDVYQLGLVLYQMITGRNPFDVGSIGEIEKAIYEDMPEAPSKYITDAQPLDEVILSCLAKDSKKRPTIRLIRNSLYEYMKKYHGESLHLTTDNKSYVRLAVTSAFYAIKNNDISECILCLKSAKGNVTNEILRKKIKNFVKQLEIVQEEKTDISNNTIDEVEKILKEII